MELNAFVGFTIIPIISMLMQGVRYMTYLFYVILLAALGLKVCHFAAKKKDWIIGFRMEKGGNQKYGSGKLCKFAGELDVSWMSEA